MVSTPPEHSDVQRILGASSSKSAKIRALAGLGLTTSGIARLLGVRYQFAYNVLNSSGPALSLRQTEDNEPSATPLQTRVQIGEGGRLVIPAAYRSALDLQVGDEVVLRCEKGELTIRSPRGAIARAQAIVRQYVPDGRSLSGELIEDRRRDDASE